MYLFSDFKSSQYSILNFASQIIFDGIEGMGHQNRKTSTSSVFDIDTQVGINFISYLVELHKTTITRNACVDSTGEGA